MCRLERGKECSRVSARKQPGERRQHQSGGDKDWVLIRDCKVLPRQPVELREKPPREKKRDAHGREGEEQAFSDELRHERPSACAKGLLQSHLLCAAERKRRRQIHVIDSGDQQNDHRDGDEDLDVLDIAGLPQELHTCTIEMDLRERKESIGEGLNVLVGKVPHFARFDLRCKILKIRAVPHQDVGVEGLVLPVVEINPKTFEPLDREENPALDV